ncbi:MAG TPA: B12-binding domain-containing radical SAM protein, partial [Planctomycetota bacterium]|nr:B12-binding domain-containing radical SAM protein [Planctomycetota bacterium]
MADVVLVALNARWSHASLGLRYLRANLGPLFERSEILEFEASAPTAEAAAAILRRRPRLVGIG